MDAAKTLDIEENAKRTLEDYNALPEEARVELIRGEFYDMAGPNRRHQGILGYLHSAIYNWIAAKGGECKVYMAPFDVHIESSADGKNPYDTVVQPDISVICDKDKLTNQGCEGAPDWVIEIVSPGNARHDYLRKLSLYEKNGVREYWIIDPIKQQVLVYNFESDNEENDSILTVYDFKDTVKVNIYKDFEIDFSKMDLS